MGSADAQGGQRRRPKYEKRRKPKKKVQDSDDDDEPAPSAKPAAAEDGSVSVDDSTSDAPSADATEVASSAADGSEAASEAPEEDAVAVAVADANTDGDGDGDGDDDWEDDGDEDDWENDDGAQDDDDDAGDGDGFEDEEDELLREKQREKERLKKLGEERERRDEAKRKELEAQRAALEAQQRAEEEAEIRREMCRQRRKRAEEEALARRSPDDLRCPITVIMGHVDTGKTKLLDKIRRTNVQDGEAGGITQQIGATFFERSTLEEKTALLDAGKYAEPFELRIPGLLIIDTPGHEAFDNLRSRGSSLCDVAILVIDLMHGMEQTTRESLSMLRAKRVPFIVALNKVDRCFGWKDTADLPIRDALDLQEPHTREEVLRRVGEARLALNELGLNAELYWEDGAWDADVIPMCPTSAITGEGVPDLLRLLSKLSQTRGIEKVMRHDHLELTVMEVKAIDGLGTTVDAVLVNGTLHEGDTIVCCTLDGPVTTSIRAILTPPPSRELRVKADYIHHAQISGAIGVKLTGQNLEKVVAGTPIKVVGPEDEESVVVDEVMADFKNVTQLATDKVGVLAQASTLGSLEALIKFLREECDPPIPVSQTGIGPVFQKDVMRAGLMNTKGHPEYATILAFDVRIDAQAREKAEEEHVRLFTADIIYHLFDQYQAFISGIRQQRKEEAMRIAYFPCICKIMDNSVFNARDPIIVGIHVDEGSLRIGTKLTQPQCEFQVVGTVVSIEVNRRNVDRLLAGQEGAVRIEAPAPSIMVGRHIQVKYPLVSELTRGGLDALKEFFRDELSQQDIKLLARLKTVYGVR